LPVKHARWRKSESRQKRNDPLEGGSLNRPGPGKIELFGDSDPSRKPDASSS
jgi:hypothetical protein